uniref:Uncharacterized protein n=1 Tax=Arundo donax TaxID=35708 RepID=A0A0A9CAB0_ARUDO
MEIIAGSTSRKAATKKQRAISYLMSMPLTFCCHPVHSSEVRQQPRLQRPN